MPIGHSPGGPGGSGLSGGRGGHDPSARAIAFDEDAFITQRGDHLGATLEVRRETLAYWLPQGTARHVGLFLEMPDRVGAGGVEVSADGYARASVSQWLTRNEGASARRTNASSIYWPYLDEAVTVVGWGIWTAATSGTLRHFDWFRTSGPDRNPVTFTIPVGARFGVGTGIHGIGLAL
jgi:hypothetical protein